MIAELFSKPVLIFGCGNTLFGDDGFGPAVIEHLQAHHALPESVVAVDVGTSIRDILFDLLLLEARPRAIFIVDAVERPDRSPGDLFEVDVDQLPVHKANDFSLHQFPSVNLLSELRDKAGVEVRVLVVQVAGIPDEVQPGLSEEVRRAVPGACTWLIDHIEGVQ